MNINQSKQFFSQVIWFIGLTVATWHINIDANVQDTLTAPAEQTGP